MIVGTRTPVIVDPERLFVLTRFSGSVSGVIVLVVRSGFGWRFGDLQFGRALHNITKPDDEKL